MSCKICKYNDKGACLVWTTGINPHGFTCNFYKPMTHIDQIRVMESEDLARNNIKVAIMRSNETGELVGPAFWCSDGYSSENFQNALEHEIEWLNSPIEEDADETPD